MTGRLNSLVNWRPAQEKTDEGQGEDASDQQNNAYGRRKFFAMLGLDTDLGISNLHTMVLAVRYGHDESKRLTNTPVREDLSVLR